MRCISLLTLLFASLAANATMIVIEPDDFAVGEQITSEYASIVRYIDHVPHPVYAVTGIEGGYAAPTGSNHFGGSVRHFRFREDIPWYGLTFEFASPVDFVTVWGVSQIPNYLDCNVWLAGEINRGPWCDGYVEPITVGEAVQYKLSAGGLAFDRIVFGGGNGTGGFIFDRLEAHVVPEPASAALLLLGLFGIGVARSRAQA